MSTSPTRRSRPQYVFLEVKRLQTGSCVTLSGPCSVLGHISSGSSGIITCKKEYVIDGVQIKLTGIEEDLRMLFKASLLEEVVKQGFKPLSNIADDDLILSREVPLGQ